MTISLHGSEPGSSQLVVSENWYADWHAIVDGNEGVVRRVDHTLLGVDLPSGAREVHLKFESKEYARGKIVSLVAIILACAMVIFPLVAERNSRATNV